MGLPYVLVDLARRVYVAEDPEQVWRDGEPRAEERYGPWMAVRLRPQSRAEAGRSGTFVDEAARLLIGVRYRDGSPVYERGEFDAFDADDEVEVRTAEGGSYRFYVNGGVMPLRARRGFVGFTASLRRAREPEVAEEQVAQELSDGIVVGGAQPGVSGEWGMVVGEPGL